MPTPWFVVDHTKPRLRQRGDVWRCWDSTRGIVGLGCTPVTAYSDWHQQLYLLRLFMADTAMQERLQALHTHRLNRA